MPLRGLIFDFDGLIVDTETATLDAWKHLHTEPGLNADSRILHATMGHVNVKADLWAAFPSTHDRSELETRFKVLTRRLCREAAVLPGVLALLDAARASGLRLAVASNSSHAHVDGHLAARGLLKHFDAVACRDDVARPKPAPDVYLEALRRLDLPASAVVAFEDSLPGHAAAAAAGLRVVVVPNPTTAADDFVHASVRAAAMTEITLARLEQLLLA